MMIIWPRNNEANCLLLIKSDGYSYNREQKIDSQYIRQSVYRYRFMDWLWNWRDLWTDGGTEGGEQD